MTEQPAREETKPLTRWDRFVKLVPPSLRRQGAQARWRRAGRLPSRSSSSRSCCSSALGWLLRGAGLWGDLAFAILLTTAIFWIARQAAAFFLDEPAGRALPRAFATTIFVLVGLPVA